MNPPAIRVPTREKILTPIDRHSLALSPAVLDWLRRNFPHLFGPSLTSYNPTEGQRGTIVTIHGSGFSTDRLGNGVRIGGADAFVLSAGPTELRALVADDADTGPIEVTVDGRTGTSSGSFTITGHPQAGDDEYRDGPPVVTTGTAEQPSPGDVNPIGTIRVLVAMLHTSDVVPPNATTTRTGVDNAWQRVQTYYQQASYTRTDVQYDLTTFATLDGTFADFVDTGTAQNLRQNQLDRIAAIGAKAAVDQGFSLNDYQMLCLLVYTNGTFIRAWGGGSTATFTYDNGKPTSDPARISINLTTSHPLNELWINETADWGRFAHEFGHNIVSAPTSTGDGTATLGEDVYGSDLVDPSAATAARFELMGNHDSHPLFSGYHLDKLGYYTQQNIRTLDWSRNPESHSIEVAAHGLTQNTDPNRVHLIKVVVSEALTYYVQVRQRPGTTTQVFDDQIPIGAAANQGGLVVTRVIAGQMHNNQQTRFVSLLHADRVLLAGESADDPARALRIIVENDAVQTRPLVCRVRVEWAQTVADDPNGAFDLSITPWDANYNSPDLWVDRDPFGVFDKANDAQGRPLGNGDRPRVGALNRFIARVNVSGASGANQVKVTHYAVTPPGVGDNGNWSPIATQTVGSIPAGGSVDVACNWTPVVGKHTCLKAYVSAQLGEISGQNNSAQENVFDFVAAGNSPCTPVLVTTAVRNPADDRRPVRVSLDGLPRGWMAQIPHSWVWLDGKAEREIEVAIWPVADSGAYRVGPRRKQHEERYLPATAPVRVHGGIFRDYDTSVMDSGEAAASRICQIGGVFYRTHVKYRARLSLETSGLDKDERGLFTMVYCWLTPSIEGQRVLFDLIGPPGDQVATVAGITDATGRIDQRIDLTEVVDQHGGGVYSLHAETFDAEAVDDATSNTVQFSV